MKWAWACMVTTARSAKGALKMRFISPREGTDHLCRELEAGLPTAEVIISDGYFERLFYPFVEDQDAPMAASAEGGIPQGTGAFDVASLPLIESVSPLVEGGGIEAEIDFNPNTDPFLIDHQLRGKPLLPAVVSLEAAAEAAAACARSRGRGPARRRNARWSGIPYRATSRPGYAPGVSKRMQLLAS